MLQCSRSLRYYYKKNHIGRLRAQHNAQNVFTPQLFTQLYEQSSQQLHKRIVRLRKIELKIIWKAK